MALAQRERGAVVILLARGKIVYAQVMYAIRMFPPYPSF